VANATYQDGLEFLDLAAKIPVSTTVNLYALADANQALLDMKHSRINGEAVLKSLWYNRMNSSKIFIRKPGSFYK